MSDTAAPTEIRPPPTAVALASPSAVWAIASTLSLPRVPRRTSWPIQAWVLGVTVVLARVPRPLTRPPLATLAVA